MSITVPPTPARTVRVTVRDMSARDVNEVVALDAPSTGSPAPASFTAAIHQASRPQPGGSVTALVAESAGEVVGFVVARLVPGPNPAEPVGLIQSIAVDPAWRGRQIGTRLMRAAREKLGCESFAMEPSELRWDGVDLTGFFYGSN